MFLHVFITLTNGLLLRITKLKYFILKTKIAIVVAVLISSVSFSQKKWTLKQCVEHALKNNITIKQNRLNVGVAEANLKSSKGNFLPTLNASTAGNIGFNPILQGIGRAGTSAAFSGNFGLNSGVTLYAGKRNKNALKQAELDVKRNKLNLSVIENDIALNVVNNYLNVLFAKENLNVAKTQSEVSKTLVNRAQVQFNEGAIPKSDYLNVQSTAANDLQRVVIQENNLNLNLLRLAQLLQIPLQGFDIKSIDVDAPSAALLYQNSDKVYEKALTFRPEIENAKLNIENAKIGVDIAKSSYLPTVTANASAGMGYNYGLGDSNNKPNHEFLRQLNNSFNYGAGFNVSIPIFNGYKNDASVERAKIQQNISETALENQKLQLQQTIQQAYLDAKLAANTYEVAETSLKAQKEAFKNAQESYNYGAMTQFDFDQVRNRLVNAEGAAIRAKYDYVFKTKVLQFFYGENITD